MAIPLVMAAVVLSSSLFTYSWWRALKVKITSYQPLKMALGTSGVKAALPLLGGDQFDIKDPKEAAQLSSFFNWFWFSQTGGSIAGVTLIVWISSNKGWDWAFGVSTVAVLLAIVLLCIGKPFYRDNHAPKGSPIIRVLQVI
ncbi:Proton-dependent oligopeptide transporter family [Corchorus olitorius]|uniref:Proton-dependent oligopeptide transporter family n=1 Tax=Corchorus olitorius TaxID=93759 RepID=A0A1R3HKD2_9ROSI|nr:Proton-dependent oligopeptide transporter family [Corchorus olitorius]